jgi:GT2 family glycosyltransferase
VKPVEIIVVDDCSSAKARRKIEDLSELATIVDTPSNLGLSGARNFGARLATGQWLAFLDDDDVFLPRKSEVQLRYLENHPECKALGGALTMMPPAGPSQYWGGKVTKKLTVSDALYYTASMAQALMIRRDDFLKLGGFDEELRRLEDYEFGIRMIASGLETHFLAEPLFIYHYGGREQLSLNWGIMFRSELQILRRYREVCRETFGRMGYLRMVARCCRVKGEKRGSLLGRSVWLTGRLSDAIIGPERGEYY